MGINMSLSPLWISLKVALCATLFTFILGLLAARWVVSLKRGKAFLDGVFSLPMVLPPTVVGFFLLLLFGRNSLLGNLLLKLGIQVMFTWQGAVIAAVVVSFPLMYRTARGALEQVEQNLIYAARTLGMSEGKIFMRVVLPAAWPGIAAATILAFARALENLAQRLCWREIFPEEPRRCLWRCIPRCRAGTEPLLIAGWQ